jgi:beta-glucanase (GH16 family)
MKSSNNGRQGRTSGLIVLATVVVACWTGIAHNSPAHAATSVFDDEFNGTSLDTNAWVAMNRPGDLSNSEKQCYKPSNATVGGGNLVILTRVDSSCTGYSYTSAMIQWKSFNFTYGYVEVRAKLAGGLGPWPAIWMLGANCQQTNVIEPGNIPPCSWPNPGSDEIDMTEIAASNHTQVNQQIHSSAGNPQCLVGASDVSQNWHTYGLTWTAASVIWTIDGATTCTITTAVPTTPMFLLLNTAIGGLGGTIDPVTLPQSSFIDYVRVTQGAPPPSPTVISLAPSTGPSGAPVVITGTNFTGAIGVKFGTTAATAFTVDSATQITATSSPGSGTVDVTVTTAGGTSAISAACHFTYTLAPAVASLAPNNGLTSGGTSVVITGANFTGASAVKFGTAAATAFTVNSATQITATSPPGSGTVDVTVTTPAGSSANSLADKFIYTLPPAASYTAVTPVRLLDTRNSGGALGAGSVRNLNVAGVTPGAPSGSSAVVLNVTVTNTTAASYLTVYPAGATRPLASSLNWAAGKTIPGLVTVQVGSGGAITIFNGVGATDVVVDLEGYFAAPNGNAGGEVALTPARITDTRAGSGRPNAGNKLGPSGTITVQVTGAGGVPASGASAAILNITVTNTSAAGALTVWPTGAVKPLASNLNWAAGQTVPNRVFVPIGTGGQVSVFNFAGSTDVVVDVSGYFTDASVSGKQFTTISPLRLVDTRLTGQTLGTGGSFVLQVSGLGGVPANASAVVLNVTVTKTNASSFLIEYPSTVARPTASDLNWVGGQTVANMAVASLGSTGAITFYNGVGSSDVVVDLAGWFS